MEISYKLAYEIYIITIFHITALIFLFSFCLYIYLHAKKTPLLYSFLSVAAMLLLWIVSKIFKTVSPSIELRWFFILTQYFAIDFLGFCLLIFAYIYSKDKLPSKKQLTLWSLPSFLAFGMIITNPLHMGFYSYFDFYKDRFGPLFFPTQIAQYIFWLIGIVMLSNNFTKQPAFKSKRGFGILFAVITLIPLLTNLYYTLFKLSVFKWVLPFPVFDITPIAGAVALILFTIPAYKFRFFDISLVSHEKLFELLPYGIVFVNKKKTLYSGNNTFYRMFQISAKNISLYLFAEKCFDPAEQEALFGFLKEKYHDELECKATNGNSYRIRKNSRENGHLLYFTDITEINKNRALLTEQNTELHSIKLRLDKMAESTKALATAKMKSEVAQNVHDILGHSLTVVIGMAELAAGEQDSESAKKRLFYADELLNSSLADLKNALDSDSQKWEKTSLISAAEHLKNENIIVDIAVHGDAYEISSTKTDIVNITLHISLRQFRTTTIPS